MDSQSRICGRGRAFRRQQSARLELRAMRLATRVIRDLRDATTDGEVFSLRRAYAQRHRDNMKKCSCWMCGNPRHYHGELSPSERRASGAAEAELRDEGL